MDQEGSGQTLSLCYYVKMVTLDNILHPSLVPFDSKGLLYC